MRWSFRKRPKTVVHRWFAWYPVRIYKSPNLNNWAWLEEVSRRWVDDPAKSGAVDNSHWEYFYITPNWRFL